MERCEFCGEKVKVIKDKPYSYDECGLNVILYGIPQFVCEKCDESYVSIPKAQLLHRLIGLDICTNKKALFTAEEIKFLRKDLHQKSKDLAAILGVTKSTISKWENGKTKIGEAHDRLLRSLYMMYASEKTQHTICDGVINIFKELPSGSKRKEIQKSREISINPQEWLDFQSDLLCPV